MRLNVDLTGRVYRRNTNGHLYIIKLVDDRGVLNKFTELYKRTQLEYVDVSSRNPLIVVQNANVDKEIWIQQYNTNFLDDFTPVKNGEIVARLTSVDLTIEEYTIFISLLSKLDHKDAENILLWSKIIPAIEQIKD